VSYDAFVFDLYPSESALNVRCRCRMKRRTRLSSQSDDPLYGWLDNFADRCMIGSPPSKWFCRVDASGGVHESASGS
jgi:hypothetical protein